VSQFQPSSLQPVALRKGALAILGEQMREPQALQGVSPGWKKRRTSNGTQQGNFLAGWGILETPSPTNSVS
jgi:hypothetical protein